jgi:hypothetical protein
MRCSAAGARPTRSKVSGGRNEALSASPGSSSPSGSICDGGAGPADATGWALALAMGTSVDAAAGAGAGDMVASDAGDARLQAATINRGSGSLCERGATTWVPDSTSCAGTHRVVPYEDLHLPPEPDLSGHDAEEVFLGFHSIEPSAPRAQGPPQYRKV